MLETQPHARLGSADIESLEVPTHLKLPGVPGGSVMEETPVVEICPESYYAAIQRFDTFWKEGQSWGGPQ